MVLIICRSSGRDFHILAWFRFWYAKDFINRRIRYCSYVTARIFICSYARKDLFQWISVIRLPDFVTKADLEWAVAEATRKKKMNFSKVEFLTYNEGLCVQCMHIGPYDDEPATVELMHRYAEERGYTLDINDHRFHHELYLSDARKVKATKLKTVIRHPIKRKYLVREIQKQEIPLLNDFLYEAIFIPEGVTPPPKSIINSEELQVYVRDFGTNPDDKCLVAEVGGKVVGAVWSRIMNDYGHIAEDTPACHLAIQRLPQQRDWDRTAPQNAPALETGRVRECFAVSSKRELRD